LAGNPCEAEPDALGKQDLRPELETAKGIDSEDEDGENDEVEEEENEVDDEDEETEANMDGNDIDVDGGEEEDEVEDILRMLSPLTARAAAGIAKAAEPCNAYDSESATSIVLTWAVAVPLLRNQRSMIKD
jgi:hypothetical protein